jgi:hypothetical protein
MKKPNILLLIFLLLFTSCNKDDDSLPYWSKISAQKNGKLWETKAEAYFHIIENTQLFSINAYSFDKNGEITEVLSFVNFPVKIGSHLLSIRNYNLITDYKYAGYTYSTSGSDVVGDRLYVNKEDDNFINFTTIDTINFKLKGNFQVTFVSDINDPIENENLPDTIRFTKGEFCVNIKDKR